MQLMTIHQLQSLVGQKQPPCLSIYLPTHRHYPGTEEDRIRFRNLLTQGENLLREKYRDRDVSKFIEPIEKLSTPEFWRYQEDGLAIFCSPDVCVHYRLPVTVPEVVVVSDTFHTKPLLQYLQSNRHYFLLSVSRKEVKLFEGSPHSLDEIELDSLPQDLSRLIGVFKAKAFPLAQSAAEDDTAKLEQRRGQTQREKKKDLLAYFRAIDRALTPVLRDERSPLVLAAVSYYHPLFQEASRYPNILPAGIEGNVEHMTPDELRKAAWQLVSAYETDHEVQLIEQYKHALSVGKASNSLPDIARAVVHGRVRTLLHEAGKIVWGKVDPNSGDLTVHPDQRQHDVEDADVIDDLCELTMVKGGEVFEVSSDYILGDSPLGAIYRY